MVRCELYSHAYTEFRHLHISLKYKVGCDVKISCAFVFETFGPQN